MRDRLVYHACWLILTLAVTFFAGCRMSFEEALKLAESKDATEKDYALLAAHEDVDIRIAVASNPAVPITVLEMLVDDPDCKVREKLLRNCSLPVEWYGRVKWDDCKRIEDWIKGSFDNRCYNFERIEKLLYPKVNTSPEILREIAGFDFIPFNRRLARHENTPDDVLKALAQSDDLETRRMVAHNKRVPENILKTLYDSEYLRIQTALAFNPNTSKEMLIKLSKIHSSDIDIGLSCNPNTPPAVLSDIMDRYRNKKGRDEISIQEEISKNPNVPVQAIYPEFKNHRDELGMMPLVDFHALLDDPATSSEMLDEITRIAIHRRMILKCIPENPATSPGALSRIVKEYILGMKDGTSYTTKQDMMLCIMGNTKTPVETVDFVAEKIRSGAFGFGAEYDKIMSFWEDQKRIVLRMAMYNKLIKIMPGFDPMKDLFFARISVEFKGASYTRTGGPSSSGRNYLAEQVTVIVYRKGPSAKKLGTWKSPDPKLPKYVGPGKGDIIKHLSDSDIADMKRYLKQAIR